MAFFLCLLDLGGVDVTDDGLLRFALRTASVLVALRGLSHLRKSGDVDSRWLGRRGLVLHELRLPLILRDWRIFQQINRCVLFELSRFLLLLRAASRSSAQTAAPASVPRVYSASAAGLTLGVISAWAANGVQIFFDLRECRQGPILSPMRVLASLVDFLDLLCSAMPIF